jgi:hypothetical protein
LLLSAVASVSRSVILIYVIDTSFVNKLKERGRKGKAEEEQRGNFRPYEATYIITEIKRFCDADYRIF